MKGIAKIIIASVITIAVISVILTVVAPSHYGEIREDLQVGDYYILDTENLLTSKTVRVEERITEINKDGFLKITRTYNGTTEHYTTTKELFLQKVLFSHDSGYENVGYATLDTRYGSRFCTIYENGNSSNQYWVGEHGIVYKSCLFGSNSRLIETSLIIR